MRLLSSLLFLLISLAVVLLGVSFALLNASKVTVNYYLNTLTMPLSLVLVMAVGMGLLLGIVLMSLKYVQLKTVIRRLKSRVRIAEQEIENLRAIPIKDTH